MNRTMSKEAVGVIAVFMAGALCGAIALESVMFAGYVRVTRAEYARCREPAVVETPWAETSAKCADACGDHKRVWQYGWSTTVPGWAGWSNEQKGPVVRDACWCGDRRYPESATRVW